MITPYKLKYSEIIQVDSTLHLFTQDFLIKLQRNKEFDGKISNKQLQLYYLPQQRHGFWSGVAMDIKIDIKEKEIILCYKFPKEQLVIHLLYSILILTFYFLDQLEIINTSNPIPIWVGPISPFIIYILTIALFQYYLKICKQRVRSFLSKEP